VAAPLRRLRAQATNASGTVDTPAATLRVTPAPVAAFIATSPAAVNVGVGATPSFRVVAGGTPAPTLQWQVSADGGVNFANVTGATGADLALAAVVVGDNGRQFRVVALNATGTATSAVAMLTVRPPPQILQQPQPQAWRSGLPAPQFRVADGARRRHECGGRQRDQQRCGAGAAALEIRVGHADRRHHARPGMARREHGGGSGRCGRRAAQRRQRFHLAGRA